jgi:hypothetical protein
MRKKIFRTMEEPTYSKWATGYAVSMSVVLLLSISTFIAESWPTYYRVEPVYFWVIDW